MKLLQISAVAAAIALAACGSNKPETTAGLSAEMPLAAPAEGSTGASNLGDNTLVYRSPKADLSKYHGVYIPAADIYRGADADFGDVSPQDQQQLSLALTQDVGRALSRNRNVVSRPGPGIVTLQLTLAGVSRTRPILSLTRVTPIGLGITAIKSVGDMPAAFVGAVTVAGKFTDSQTGEILGGFVTRQSPPAYDLRSSAGTVTTAQLALSHMATGLATAIDDVVGNRR